MSAIEQKAYQIPSLGDHKLSAGPDTLVSLLEAIQTGPKLSTDEDGGAGRRSSRPSENILSPTYGCPAWRATACNVWAI
jgi:hypothetical protein